MYKLLINLVIIFLIYKLLTTKFTSGPVVYVQAKNGVSYLVRNLPDKQKAADLLADLASRAETLVKHLKTNFKDDPRTIALSKFNFKNMSESSDTTNYTTYTENKSFIYFCLRDKDSVSQENFKESCDPSFCGPFVDINTLSGICFHEMTHIGMNSYDSGHSSNFQENLKFVLGEAVKLGLYNNIDYSKSPVKYCGIIINSALI